MTKRLLRFPLWRKLKNMTGFQVFLILFLTLLSIFMMLPIIYLFNHAFKPASELFKYPPTFMVDHPTLKNFSDLILATKSSAVPVTRYLFNNIISTSLTVLVASLFSILCAFALSKGKFPGKNLLFSTIVISLMFAPETVQIPRYFVISNLGLIDTYWAHVLPLVAMPVGVFLMKQFIDQIPNEMLEAARLEGANELRLLTNVIVPLSLPAVATVAILSFQGAWSNLETSTFFIEDETMKTLPFYVLTLTSGLGNSVARQGVAAAATLLMFIPNLVFFLLLQRKVIDTMMHSGIK
ncbi:carbohydrate ABC transporter permease [Paenibacillus nasutitermitis]|uniref:ABC transporter permease n=1 Tax=Paenibacillus nasutitermitis TaxID=1652958 RepID=A0A916ZFV9_9BACL|nr:carbohydrate ABC transporter permease [Paenibacillus nasutitermitis]GGD93502.1 ABC transporter permease [Paenibacillus nasutitermitis]